MAHHPIFDARKTLQENDVVEPKQEFLGHKVYSNFGISACPATTNSSYVRAAFESGFNVVTYKTQRSVVWPSNVYPNVMLLDLDGEMTPELGDHPITGQVPAGINSKKFTIANSCGINCEGPNYWLNDLTKALSYVDKGQVLIMSIVGTIKPGMTEEEYYADFAEAAKMAEACGASIIELNLSCPNVIGEGVLCYNGDAVRKICELVRGELSSRTRLGIKLGFYPINQEELFRGIIEDVAKYIDFISVINTMSGKIVDEAGKQAFPGPGREKAGVSGAAIKWAGINMVQRLRHIRNLNDLQFEIIGMGGVMSKEDYDEYIEAGADAVQSATAAMWNPRLALEIAGANF